MCAGEGFFALFAMVCWMSWTGDYAKRYADSIFPIITLFTISVWPNVIYVIRKQLFSARVASERWLASEFVGVEVGKKCAGGGGDDCATDR